MVVPTVFVDRAETMAELRALATGLGRGRAGWGLAVSGVAGMGKSALLDAYQRELQASGTCRAFSVRCHPGIGPGLQYGPVAELLMMLGHESARSRRKLKNALKRAGEEALNSAPRALSVLVPGLGDVFALGRDVTKASLASGSMPFDSLLPFQQGAALHIVEELVRLLGEGRPSVVIIDDIQNIDHSSLLVVDQLLRRAEAAGVGILVSHSTGTGPTEGPSAAVDELLYQWQSDGLIDRRALPGLPPDAVRQLVAAQHPEAPPELSARLSQVTSGHSVFVMLCLDAWTPDQGGEVSFPPRLELFVESRLALLSPDDRELLMVGAAQGAEFLSRIVSAVLDVPDQYVTERLRLIARTPGLLTRRPLPAWATGEPSDCYAFAHQALWTVVYELQTPEQRRSRHERIAEALTPQGDDDLPLERRLEIARHLKKGGHRCLAACADAHYALARDAAMDGLSFSEAEQHCDEAIRAARLLPAHADGRHKRLVPAIELLLSLTEVRWQGQNRASGGLDIDALAAEAEAAATACDEPELMIRTTLMRGKTQMATRGLEPSLVKLRRAVELAEEHGDPVALFVARVEYGRQVSKRHLAEGLAQLTEAERMYASDPRLGESGDPVLQHARNLAEMQLGITLFDSGHLSEALERLLRCAGRLRGEALQAELPIALNYLAQVLTGLGERDRTERTLQEAREFEARRGGDSGWHAYNTALLAKSLATRPERAEESLRLIAEAWDETERTWLVNLVPIVRNLYAEVLLRLAADRPGLLARADRLAVDTCHETEGSGMIRSKIAAHSLRSRILLRQGDPAGAVAQAREAVSILDETGPMPALRTEEILFHAAVVLGRTEPGPAVGELLDRARAEVARKGDLISDPAVRETFLREALNRAILDGPDAES